MRNKIQKYLSGEREGFSLIELIIVIAIMAILIGVVALVVLPYLESARESSDRASLSAVSTAFNSAVTKGNAAKEYKTPTAISSDATLKAAVEKYMKSNKDSASSIADAEAFQSTACSGCKFYAVNTKDASGKSTTYVMISKDGQKPAVDSDGQPFKE